MTRVSLSKSTPAPRRRAVRALRGGHPRCGKNPATFSAGVLRAAAALSQYSNLCRARSRPNAVTRQRRGGPRRRSAPALRRRGSTRSRGRGHAVGDSSTVTPRPPRKAPRDPSTKALIRVVLAAPRRLWFCSSRPARESQARRRSPAGDRRRAGRATGRDLREAKDKLPRELHDRHFARQAGPLRRVRSLPSARTDREEGGRHVRSLALWVGAARRRVNDGHASGWAAPARPVPVGIAGSRGDAVHFAFSELLPLVDFFTGRTVRHGADRNIDVTVACCCSAHRITPEGGDLRPAGAIGVHLPWCPPQASRRATSPGRGRDARDHAAVPPPPSHRTSLASDSAVTNLGATGPARLCRSRSSGRGAPAVPFILAKILRSRPPPALSRHQGELAPRRSSRRERASQRPAARCWRAKNPFAKPTKPIGVPRRPDRSWSRHDRGTERDDARPPAGWRRPVHGTSTPIQPAPRGGGTPRRAAAQAQDYAPQADRAVRRR